MYDAIRAREAEVATLDAQLAEPDQPLEERLAVIPTWVRQQLEDLSDLLRGTPEGAKAEFKRLGISFTITPVAGPDGRSFLRAEGSGQSEHLAFSRFSSFTTTGALHLRRER